MEGQAPNKFVFIDRTGAVQKRAGAPVVAAVARTVWVPDVGVMEQLLRHIADDSYRVLIQGYYLGTEPKKDERYGQEFIVASQKTLSEHTGQADPAGWCQMATARASNSTRTWSPTRQSRASTPTFGR